MKANARISLRRARDADLQSLRAIYADAVRSVGPTAYSPDQVKVWSAFAGEMNFSAFILTVNTYLAVIDDQVVGFCGIADDGHVASIYVRPGWFGEGIASRLLSAALRLHPEPISGRYYAEASIFSLPLFERFGFRQTGSEQADRYGVTLERFLVERVATGPV
jgi:putative acetyltransferase